MRALLSLALAFLAAVLSADPALAGRFDGPLISVVNSDRASYAPGQQATVTVSLDNRTGTSFGGSMVVTVTSRGQAVLTVTRTVPAMAACIEAPPNSSESTTCPMAAFTSAGPARYSPDPSVMISVSHMTGRYAPPATQLPMIAAICGMPRALMRALR